MKVWVLIGALALTACADQRQERIAKMKDAVSQQLRDPGSAQFSNLKYDASGFALCGEVNGRNGFGGYAGKTRFYATSDDKSVTVQIKRDDEAPVGLFDSTYNIICRNTQPL